MNIPRFWAESRLTASLDQRQITVRRFGWSNDSQLAAHQHASQRAQEALDKITAGQKLAFRERKVGYNGAEALPIREEILDRVGDFVVTRNSYGARCLNTPNVFFADIDFDGAPFTSMQFWLSVLMAAIGSAILVATTPNTILAVLAFIPFAAVSMLLNNFVLNVIIGLRAGSHQIAMKKIESFSEKHPDWHLRVYQTPNGYRILAMHDILEPRSAEVSEAFRFLSVDPAYARMCVKQNCFRARLTAKPWRAGFGDRLSRAVWPIEDSVALQARQAWVEGYEKAASRFSSCRFERALGATNRISPEAEEVRQYHDEACKASSRLSLA